MQTLTVDLGERSYPIHIGPHLLTQSTLIEGLIPGRNVLIVSNDTVAPLYLDAVKKLFAGRVLAEVILPDGEAFKTLEMADRVYTALLEQRMDRKTTLVALGGGVIGDLTGFVAATYQRGVNFVQIPTTLLAQVDSSVGGKTAVNHPLGKNMIGAFHQPLAVLADTATLDTLPDRELRAGLAEVIKYGLLADRPFLDWIETNLAALLNRDADTLSHAIRRSCEIKAAIVAEDEREAGRRALLNLGHTFGHAIETAAGYGNWLHGEAVATGMLMAADLSARLGWISEDDLARVERVLVDAGLPVVPPPIAPERFMDLMAVDKKNVDGQLRLVLMRALGEAVLTAEADPALLRATLAHYHAKAA